MSAHFKPGSSRRPWTAALTAVAVGLLATTVTAQPGETGHIAFTRDGDVWAADADGTDQVQLTSGPEDERWPRWSPEGNRIAVVQDGDLVLLRATGARLRRLTTHGDVVAAPSWSPDGRYLAYVRTSDGIAIVDTTQADSNGTLHELGAVTSVAWNPQHGDQIAYTDGGAIFTVHPDGSEAGTEIVPPDSEGRTREELSWDPLTGQVVFTSPGTDGTRIEGAGISLGGAEGDDRSPAWSADGQHMFFTRGDTLHVYERDQFPIPVRSLGAIGATPDIQPSLVESAAAYETGTGTQVSFRVRSPGVTPTIVAYQAVSAMGSATAGTDYVAESGEVATPDAFGNAVVVPVFVFGDSEPEPDETFYVDFTFPSDPAAPLRVRGTILNDDGGRNGVVTYTADQVVWALDPVRGAARVIVGSAGSAVYSPSGDRLAYLGSEAGQVQLVVADPSGAPQVTFPIAGAFDHEIVWSPDGARLAWTVGAALWVADPSNPASASAIATDAVTPSWSSDTGPGPRRLAFARVGTGMVCTVREDGSDESCLTAGFQPQWSADNTTIAFLRGAAVFLMNPDGTNERVAAFIPGSPDARLLRWSPRGGSFAFMTDIALFVGQEGSPAASVPGLPASLSGFDWSPDGRQLVVQATDWTGHTQLWIAGPDEASAPFLAVRQATAVSGGAVEPRWSGVPVRPTAGLTPRGGFERFGQVRVEVQLDAPSPDTVALTWETVDTGSATPDVDFTAGTGTVALQPGETMGVIVVSVLDDALEEGPESFDVRLTGATGARLGSESQVSVFITDDDGVPVAVPDVAATALDTPVDIPVLDNDSDPDGDPVSLTGVDHPAHGTATLAGSLVTYTPQPGFEGVDHFLYTISDGQGHSATGLVSVSVGMPLPPAAVLTVTPPFLDFGKVPLNKTKDLVVTVTNNTAQPVALAEVFPLDQADPRPFDVSDFEGLQACRAPAACVLEPGQSCTQKVRFWSIPGAEAASPATARLLDGVTFETLATFPLFASTAPPDTGPNLPPVAVDDLAGVAPGFTHTLDAVRNDSDPDHDILRITAVSDPPHGTTAVVPCQSFPQNPNADCVRYVPDAGYTGTDAFVYTVSDGRGGDATATFHLAVGNVVPQVAAITPASGPIAGGQAVRITGSGFVYRSEVSFLCPSGQLPLEVSQRTDTEILATTPPAPGGLCTVRVRTLFAREGQLANAYRYNTAPLAQDGAVSTNEGTPVAITLTATDADGDPLAFTIVGAPTHGALSAVTGAQATYTPAADYNGPDSFTFRASDGQADSNVATVSITVQALATHVLSVTKAGSGGGEVTFTPPGILGVEALAAGYTHACAIRDDGRVACWGGNFRGEANAPGGTFRSTTAGDLYTCGVRTDSTVVCWGTNDFGEATPPTGGFASASAGGGHTCGLRAEGILTCWGRNNIGQTNAPASVFRAVSAGFEHTCAIRNDRTLACWGRNSQGQATAPVGTFESVAAGDLHTCAVRTDGTVACWGHDSAGQAAPPPGTFTSVSAGFVHSCGLRGDGAVVCWGDNSSGQLNAPAGAFTAVAAGRNYTCATRDSGALACWGVDNHGQTAAPAGDFLVACPTCRTYPAGTEVTVEAIPDADSVFSGWSGDCAGTGTCTVTMDGDRSVTATFVAATATPTTTTVTTSGSPSLLGQTVTLTAAVTSAGGSGATPAGQVHFEDTTAGTPLGTVPLDASGSAILQTSALAVGTHTIQATYLPAAGQLYSGSSGMVVQTVDANVPSVAVDDGPFSVIEGDTLTVPPPGVLANDVDPELAVLTARFVTAPAHGVLFLRPSGGFDYTPGVGYAGPDSFTYVANDGYGDSNVATVSLTVHSRVVAIDVAETVHVTDGIAVDPAVMIDIAETILVSDNVSLKTSPLAHDGTASTVEDTPVLVSLSATDSDGDPFTLTIVSGPAHGTVFPPAGVVMPSGTLVTYTPAPDYVGADSFTFKATDSQGDSNLATVAIVVQPAPGQEVVTATVPPGGTLTTDAEGDGATSEDVIETTVLTPQGGDVIIDETPAPAPPPTAFTFLPHQVQIAAPPGSASQPLLLTFLIDDSAVSAAGGTLATLGVFRNGFEVPPCRPGATATPDPCVALRQLVDDDVRLVVRTSWASVWTFGVPRSTSGAVNGALRPLTGGTVAFAAARIHGQLVGALTYRKGRERFVALRVSAFAVEDDGHTAWFAGLGVDGRAFLAYAEDGGADGDVFRLWISGEDKTGDGSLASGQVVVAP